MQKTHAINTGYKEAKRCQAWRFRLLCLLSQCCSCTDDAHLSVAGRRGLRGRETHWRDEIQASILFITFIYLLGRVSQSGSPFSLVQSIYRGKIWRRREGWGSVDYSFHFVYVLASARQSGSWRRQSWSQFYLVQSISAVFEATVFCSTLFCLFLIHLMYFQWHLLDLTPSWRCY